MDLKLPPGLDRGATAYESPNRWWDCNLVRWQDGIIRPIGGWERNTASPLGNARALHVWRDNLGGRHSLVGTDTQLWTENAGAYLDVTPSGFQGASIAGPAGGYGTWQYGDYPGATPLNNYGTARPASNIYSNFFYWTMSNWGEDVLAMANSDSKLYHYVTTPVSGPPVAPTAVSGAPTGTAVIVTDQRHVMIIGATGTPMGTSGGPRVVAWSSQEDYTDWNFASTTNTAGFQALASDAVLQIPYKVREGVLIMTQAEVFLARYLGLPFIYGFERLAEISLMTPMAVATFNGQAIWMGRQSFWHYAGGVVQPLDCSISNDIFTSIDPVYGPYRSFACENGLYPEVWFFYPEIGQTECNRVAIFNHQARIWYWAKLARSAMAPAGAYKLPMAGGTDGHIYTHESGYLDAGNPRVGNVWIESGMVAAGQADRTLEIAQVMLGTGSGYDSLQLTAFSRMTQEGAERTFGPYNPRANGYTDTRISGRDVRLRFVAKRDEEWAVGRARIEAVQGTGR